MQPKTSLLGKNIIFDENSINENIKNILEKRFLENFEEEIFHNPYLFNDLEKAVERIKSAKENDEKIMIFGDYDVDGVTSTSIVMHFFKKIGLKASYRLPHRIHDGYGLKDYFIDEMHKLGVTLLITVDCGSKDLEIVKYAKTLGIDVIITDHHNISEVSEEAIAVINPKRKDSNYPYKDLCGAGVALKLVSALAKEFLSEEESEKYIESIFDIAAIGTVADCMPLTGENRFIVKKGLEQIKKSRSLALKEFSRLSESSNLDADFFAFTIGPKLNAAGRMDSPYKALKLILDNSENYLENIEELNLLNEERKAKTAEFTNLAMQNISLEENIILWENDEISHGIIGIVAGKLTEEFFKPSIILKREEDKFIASCRSPEYFSIIEFLNNYKDLFISYGGHTGAAGFSISLENFEIFKNKVLEDSRKFDFSEFKKSIYVDKVINLEEIGFNLLDEINEYKPFGIGNTKPIFMIENFSPSEIKYLGKGVDHLKFENKFGFKIFAFFLGQFCEDLKSVKTFSIIFEISEDNFNGNRGIMLKILDFVLN